MSATFENIKEFISLVNKLDSIKAVDKAYNYFINNLSQPYNINQLEDIIKCSYRRNYRNEKLLLKLTIKLMEMYPKFATDMLTHIMFKDKCKYKVNYPDTNNKINNITNNKVNNITNNKVNNITNSKVNNTATNNNEIIYKDNDKIVNIPISTIIEIYCNETLKCQLIIIDSSEYSYFSKFEYENSKVNNNTDNNIASSERDNNNILTSFDTYGIIHSIVFIEDDNNIASSERDNNIVDNNNIELSED